jgi:hypothetical protein
MVKKNSKSKTYKYKKYRGGAFTGNQLHDLLNYQYAVAEANMQKDPKKREEILAAAERELQSSIQAHPLNKENELLYNDSFQVFFIPTSKRIIVVHRGTVGTARDWGNNVRNMTFGVTRSTSTFSNLTKSNRQLTAEKGHKEIEECLKRIYNKKKSVEKDESVTDPDTGISVEDKGLIVTELDELSHVSHPQIGDITIDEAIDEFLKRKMSVIGHSQGAIYAYLYGIGASEVIVFNPAPFPGTKPDHTYIIRRIGDPVSSWTTTSDNQEAKQFLLEKLKGSSDTEQHSITSLNGMTDVFGNKFTFDEDGSLETSSLVDTSKMQLEVTTGETDKENQGVTDGIEKEVNNVFEIRPAEVVTPPPGVNAVVPPPPPPPPPPGVNAGGKTKRKLHKNKKRKHKSIRKYKK